MGVLLIVIGLAFALLAVAVVLNRREAAAEQAEGKPEGEEAASEGEEPAGQMAAGAAPDAAAEAFPPHAAGTPGTAPTAEAAAGAQGAEHVGEPPAPGARAGAQGAGPAEPGTQATTLPESPSPSPRALLPLAELLREDVTGRLVLRMGEQVIRTPEDIQNEADRRRLQYASADLAEWFQGSETPARRAAGRRGAGQPRAADEPRPDEAGPPESPRPRSMIEAINAILDRQLAGAQGAARAVRLVPDPGGGVRVLIGVKSYPLDEVPDEGIRQTIRQAVAEWEASQ
jgi:hypothetical protein